MVLLMAAGFQLPMIPFKEVVAKTGATEPIQNAGIAAKLGTVGGNTVTFKI